jgi:hypothetical protein
MQDVNNFPNISCPCIFKQGFKIKSTSFLYIFKGDDPRPIRVHDVPNGVYVFLMIGKIVKKIWYYYRLILSTKPCF